VRLRRSGFRSDMRHTFRKVGALVGGTDDSRSIGTVTATPRYGTTSLSA